MQPLTTTSNGTQVLQTGCFTVSDLIKGPTPSAHDGKCSLHLAKPQRRSYFYTQCYM